MPKTKRDMLRRSLATAQIDLEDAAENLIPVHDEFEPVHPEDAQVLSFAIEGISNIKDLLNVFCVKVWGHVPESWEDWRGQAQAKTQPKAGRPVKPID